MKVLRYNIIYRPEPEGGYTVIVPALPGCITYGKDIEEAQRMAKEAIECYIGSLKKHREPVPASDTASFFGSIELPIRSPSAAYA